MTSQTERVQETIVVRNSQYDRRHLYAKSVYIPEYNKYTGLILPTDPPWDWVAKDCILLLDVSGQFRIIPKENIRNAPLAKPVPNVAKPLQLSSPASSNWIWQVNGSKHGVTYTVELNGNLWSCTCLGYAYRYDCKHITKCKSLLLRELNHA